jgi:hypothetical protein
MVWKIASHWSYLLRGQPYPKFMPNLIHIHLCLVDKGISVAPESCACPHHDCRQISWVWFPIFPSRLHHFSCNSFTKLLGRSNSILMIKNLYSKSILRWKCIKYDRTRDPYLSNTFLTHNYSFGPLSATQLIWQPLGLPLFVGFFTKILPACVMK